MQTLVRFNSKRVLPLGGCLLLGFLFFLHFHNLEAVSDSPFWLTVAGDLRGEIKPCGCSSEGDMGGLLRRASYLEQLRTSRSPVYYLDLGNNFPPPSEQGRLKVELIQNTLKRLKPLVILLGPNELLYEQSLLDLQLPYILTNVRADWFVKKSHFEMQAEQRIGIWGYLSPTQIYQNKNEEQAVFPVDSPLLEEWRQELQKSRVDFSILLFRGNEEELTQFEQSHLFDLIITGSNNDDELNQILSMQTATGTFPAVPTKGQGALQAHIDLSNKTPRFEVIWLYDDFADHPEILPFFDNYNEHVKELFFTNLDRMEKHERETPYGGDIICKACHIAQHAIWSSSGHSHAYATLQNVNKHFDLECLQCHVVGLNQDGFLSAELTPTLLNVQCENCHGPAKAHIRNPTQEHPPTKPAGQACISCHRGSHSPTFEFSTYWAKIAH